MDNFKYYILYFPRSLKGFIRTIVLKINWLPLFSR